MVATYQGHRKEILTYTAMVNWLKPYRLVQKLNDYKKENIVCRAHMHTKYEVWRHDAPENFEKF